MFHKFSLLGIKFVANTREHSFMCYCSNIFSSHKEGETSANYFTADDYEEADVDQESSERQTPASCTTAAVKRLPNPLSGSTDERDDDESHSSVFVNYYHKAERAKLAVLEQHVKLTTAKDAEGSTDGDKHKKGTKKRQICLNFQRGRCRYGQKCKFAHSVESEMDHVVDSDAAPAKETNNLGVNKFGSPPPFFYDSNVTGDANEYVNDDDDGEGNKKRKKRSGISDTLVPPKKALHSLEKQRREERPWTVKPK